MLNRRLLNPLALYKPVDYGPRYFPRSPILYYSRKPIDDELLYAFSISYRVDAIQLRNYLPSPTATVLTFN